LRKLLKKYGFFPDRLITDELRSHGAAARDRAILSTHAAVYNTFNVQHHLTSASTHRGFRGAAATRRTAYR